MNSRRFMLPLLVLLAAWLDARAAVIAPQLQQALPADAEVALIVRFAERVDAAQFAPTTSGGRSALIRALQEQAQASQGHAREILRRAGARRVTPLWLINALAVTAPADVIAQLAALPGVARIEPDAEVQAPAPLATALAAAEWNLAAVRAPQFWGLGYLGSGIVVATLDTGVDAAHPDLAPRWRGGANSWFDPHGEHSTPHDQSGHGTQVMGLLLGGVAGGTAIGVAPDARWIAAKIFNDAGVGTLSTIHQGFQWLLDPDRDPATDDAPDVVNNSWGFPELMNQCYTEFQADIDTLKAADIAVVFAAGNQGPASASSVSPANNPSGYAVGGIDNTLNVAAASGRGPSACGGALYPNVVAPGFGVRTADLTFGGLVPDAYVSVSGTSAAAPHIAGVMALLRQAHPDAGVVDLERALQDSAVDLGTAGPDNQAGHGLVDVVAASELLASRLPPPPVPSCTDGDGDGFHAEASCGTLVDCNDADAGINPAACDIKADGIDQNCDGVDRLKGKACPVSGGGVEGEGSTCSDAIDNDGDGLIDCRDPDCGRNRLCRLR